MVTEMNISQFRDWLDDADSDDLVTMAPLLLSTIGTLDERHQARFIEKVKSDPRARSVFEKLNAFAK